jgi:two-component system cell cycle sensor histidine kinase/response regulator CckA
MPAGGTIRITVGRRALDAEACRAHGWGVPGEYVTLSVTDTGCGMDDATRARIFEPFFTTKPAGQGTGLGMPMVYGLVKDHGGFVQVYSEPMRGTTVRLYFPVAEPRPAEPAPRPTAEVRGGTETILLVEDAEDVRRAATRVLQRHGYTVVALADGREALAVIRAGHAPADLIISDVVMPHTSGPELLKALRETRLPTRVLLTSGYTAREVRDRMEVDPEIPFLPKPWTAVELLGKVREALDAAPEGDGPPRRRATDVA